MQLALEGRWRTWRRRYDLEGYLFLAPDLVGTLVFAVGPVLAALGLGLFAWDILTPPRFVGLDNYRALLLDDPVFRQVLVNTSVYVLGSVPLRTALALLLAIALNQQLRGVSLFRAAYFLPTITSAVAAATVWRWIYEPNFGLLNSLLYAIGVQHPPTWLSSPAWAMPALILLGIWQGLGFQMVIFLAGLQGIPTHLYEAAAIDGAGWWPRFRHITLPLISPTTFFVLIISVIGSYQVFDQAFVLTEGGPGYATTTLVYYIYEYAFQFFKMGYAAAMAWILFAIVFVLTVLQFRVQARWVHYD
ncbi:MAG: sugar ABC transporter permease [Chloroflexota bacterium]|nr:sugar ABC transporter permease [Chloroflexota bacterium]